MQKYLFCFIAFCIVFSSCKEESDPTPVARDLSEYLIEMETHLPPANYKDLTFINDSVGIAVGGPGIIMRTADGGNSWRKIDSGTDFLLSHIRFFNHETGYIIGREDVNGVILKTIDGGLHWNIEWQESWEYPSGISVPDSLNGYILMSNYLLRTQDRGETWNRVPLEHGVKGFTIDFKNLNEGIMGSSNGAFYRTSTSGYSWERVQSKLQSHLYNAIFRDDHTYIKSDSHLLILDKNNNQNIVSIPHTFKIHMIGPTEAIGIGHKYDELGSFPHGVIYYTKEFKTWSEQTQFKNSAYQFISLAPMGKNKYMIIGFNAHEGVVLVFQK